MAPNGIKNPIPVLTLDAIENMFTSVHIVRLTSNDGLKLVVF